MSYWDTLPPTEKQVSAIETYNQTYGIKLVIKSKQDAHDLISVFVPKQILEFEGNIVKGTNIAFTIIDQKRFEKNAYNRYIKDNVKKIEIKDGIAILSIKKKVSTLDVLEECARYQDILTENPSMSEEEDNLGFLSPEELEMESDMYGSNPMWWE